MGVVYLAVARGPGGFSKLLVLKALKPEFAEDRGVSKCSSRRHDSRRD